MPLACVSRSVTVNSGAVPTLSTVGFAHFGQKNSDRWCSSSAGL